MFEWVRFAKSQTSQTDALRQPANGDFQKAITTIQKAIALDPNRKYFSDQLHKFQKASEEKGKQ